MPDEEESIELDGGSSEAAFRSPGSRMPIRSASDEEEDLAKEESALEGSADPEGCDVHSGRGFTYYMISVLMGSLMTAASKVALEDTDEYVLLLFRMSGTLLLLVAWMAYKKIDHMLWGPPGLRQILFLRGAIAAANVALVYYSVQYISLPDFALIDFLTPLLTAIAAHLVLGEPYHWKQAVASCISFAGVVVVTRPSFIFGEHIKLPEGVTPRQHWIAVACILVQVVGFAAIFLLLRKIGTRISSYTVVANFALQTCVLSACALIIKALVERERIQIPTKLSTWLVLLFIGVVGFAYQFLMSLAVAREHISRLAQLDYLALVYMVLWQFLFFATLPDIFTVVGGTLIMAGVVWASHAHSSDR